jgi:hypothetical protein
MSSFNFQANLFQVGKDKNKSYPGAPTLVPFGDSYDVNVHREYSWTVSDDARSYIPKVTLTEYKLEYASELNAFNRLVKGTAENFNFLAAALGQTEIGGIFQYDFSKGVLNPTSPANLDAAATSLSEGNKLTENQFGRGDDMFDGFGNKDDVSLNPYRGLYTTKRTGWGYVLPYLGAGNMTDITNTFAQADFINRFLAPAGKYAASVSDKDTAEIKNNKSSLLAGLPAFSNIFVGGAAGAIRAEIPQTFTGTSTENIKVVFYLLNTIKPEDIRKNYEFCYLLTYQNLPNRRSINVLDSPPLYRAKVDGYKTLPICYMNDLKIENVGAVRLVDIGQTSDKNGATNSVLRDAAIRINQFNSDTVKMIPEAYKISFTLQSVFMNSQNMFVFAANPQGLVTTNVAPPVNVAPASTSTLGTENIVQTNDYGQPIFPEESTDPNQ